MNTDTFENAAAAKRGTATSTPIPCPASKKAKEHFRYAVGLKPNALVMDEDVLRHISMCEAVMERVKYTSPNAIRGQLTIEQLKAYFGVENIVVAGAVFNSAKKGKPKQIEAIWPKDKVLLARLSSGGQDLKEPSLGARSSGKKMRRAFL